MVESIENGDKGFFDWLRSARVVQIEENLYQHNFQESKSKYLFKTEEDAKFFKGCFSKVKRQDFDINYGAHFFDEDTKLWGVSVSQNSQRILKEIFQKSFERPEELLKQQQISLGEAAIKLDKYDIASKTYTVHTRANPAGEEVTDKYSRVEKDAALFRNKDVKESDFYAASSGVDLMISIYLAENYSTLSVMDREKILQAQKALLDVDSEGHFMGLKRDANFISFLKEKDINDSVRSIYIQEDLRALLFGGEREVIAHDTQSIFSAKQATQTSFFPTQDNSKTQDYIVMHGGGSSDNSSIRVLKKEADTSVPGGYRYFYTKIDAGNDAEELDKETSTATSIYTTEIVPKFQLVERDGKVILSDRKLEQKDFDELKNNPEQYVKAMQATIFELLSTDRHLIFKNKESRDAKSYDRRVKELRGEKVAERCVRTAISKSSNSTVYSIMRTIQYFTGDFIAGDMLQSFKQYHQNYSKKLLAQKEKLEQQKPSLVASIDPVAVAPHEAKERVQRKDITQAESEAARILHDKQSELQEMQQKIIAEREAKAKTLRGPTKKDAPLHVRLVGREYDWLKQQHSTPEAKSRKEKLRELYQGNSKDKGGPPSR